MGVKAAWMVGVLVPVALVAQGTPGIPEPLGSLLKSDQRAALEPKLAFQRTLQRTLTPAWGAYLGRGKVDYDAGYHAGMAYLSEHLEWGFVSTEAMQRLWKDRPASFRMGFLGACEAYSVMQRQRPALGLDEKPAPVTLYEAAKKLPLIDGGVEAAQRRRYWSAVAAVLVPNWEACASLDYGKGFREGADYVFSELQGAPTDFGLKARLKEIATRSADTQAGFLAALEAYSAYQAMAPGSPAGLSPVQILAPESEPSIPIVGTYSFDLRGTLPPESLKPKPGQTLLELLGPSSLARIVAFTDPGMPGGSRTTLEQCRHSLATFVLSEPLSVPMRPSTQGFLELRDGRTLRWSLSEGPEALLLVGPHLFRKPGRDDISHPGLTQLFKGLRTALAADPGSVGPIRLYATNLDGSTMCFIRNDAICFYAQGVITQPSYAKVFNTRAVNRISFQASEVGGTFQIWIDDEMTLSIAASAPIP